MQALYTMIQINIKPCGMSVPVTVQTGSKLGAFFAAFSRKTRIQRRIHTRRVCCAQRMSRSMHRAVNTGTTGFTQTYKAVNGVLVSRSHAGGQVTGNVR